MENKIELTEIEAQHFFCRLSCSHEDENGADLKRCFKNHGRNCSNNKLNEKFEILKEVIKIKQNPVEKAEEEFLELYTTMNKGHGKTLQIKKETVDIIFRGFNNLKRQLEENK